MSNSRYISYNGKTTASGNTTFGLTVQSGGTNSNVIQTTYEPTVVNSNTAIIQNQTFLINYNNKPITPIVAGSYNIITVNSSLISGRTYQFTANLTIIIQHTAGTYYSANFSLIASARDKTLIGSGFMLTTISKDDDFNNFLTDNNINISIINDKFNINVTTTANITTSIDAFANISVSSVEYNN
jgi:hypothetical protein